MDLGLRVEIGVSAPGNCPVADASGETGATVTGVSRAPGPDPEDEVTEEFTVTADRSPSQDGLATVARYDNSAVYQFRRARTEACVCERVEVFGRPVSDVHAAEGTLYLSFHAPDVETVQGIVEDLRERFDGVHLRKLTRAGDDGEGDLVFVDRSRLTERQREVLQTAYEMGYFDHPKGANAGEVADAVGISPSTFAEHVAAAQRKLLEAILAGA
jgi:predicted DNA binding protein